MTSTIRSPLVEYINHLVETSDRPLADYERDHCGLTLPYQPNPRRSKYGKFIDNLDFTPINVSSYNTSDIACSIEQAKRYPSHPNYTNAWSYLYPIRSSGFKGENIYQAYITDPDTGQFSTLVKALTYLDRIVVKYPRIESLEHRYDTVVAYSDSWSQMRTFCHEALHYYVETGRPNPSFAVSSNRNVSVTVYSTATMSDNSPGQYWEHEINRAIQSRSFDLILFRARQLYNNLKNLLQGAVQ